MFIGRRSPTTRIYPISTAPPNELFNFVNGDPERVGEIVARGIWPWWSAPNLRLAFWRPLSGWSHALDYRWWPENPWLMHLHSIAWHLLAIVLLLVFYRRILERPAVAGLAGLLFAIDDSQALPALWLANRNAVLAATFGIGCLLAHDCWRRDGWRAGAAVGPLLLLGAVLANEGAVAIGGYLVSYAIFLDPAPWRRRLAALLPSASVGLAWAVAYKAGGYGALGSGVYIDPLTEPARFAMTAVVRAPFLLWGSWGFPPADLSNFLPETLRWQTWGLALVLLALFAGLLRPVLRRRHARFLGFGMLLALLPASSTFASSRLLSFVGIGATGLLALLIAELWARQRTETEPNASRWGRRALLAILLVIHLIAAPLLTRAYLGQMAGLDRLVHTSATSLVEQTAPSTGEAPDERRPIIVATPSAFISLASSVVATIIYGWDAPITLILSSSIYDTEVTRSDATTLIVRPRGGFIRSPTSTAPAGISEHSLDPRRAMLMLDHLFRDLERAPFQAGDRVVLDGVTLEILEEDGGRPLTAAFRFSDPLEDERWHWLAWRDGRHEPFRLPEIGETVTWTGLYPPMDRKQP